MEKIKPKKEPSIRLRKVNSLLQQRIAEIIREADFVGLSGFITIAEVDATADLKDAKVWISVFGQDPEQVLEILNRNLPYIQSELYKGSTTKFVPKIHFKLDSSEEYSSKINKLFRKISNG